jgi:LuxR family transcriptional regulator, maltose regulon positive regulatory protein
MTMATSRERPLLGDLVAPAPSVDQFIEAKLHRPRRRDSWVHRDRLVEALDRAVTHRVTLVAAPAGYGKTTALAQWLDRPDRPATAWVSLDPGDNDPDRLWSHVVVALERAGCLLPISEPARVVGANSTTVPRAILPALLNALAAAPDDIVLVLDDFHFVQSPACHEQVQFLIAGLPAQAHLIIATRSDPGLRLGRLRASGDLAEIRAGDLSFTSAEATELLANDDVRLHEQTVSQLMERTEGWPAGLYLATLSLAGRSDPDEFVRKFSGGNRFIGDYLTEEVLSRHPDPVREFITMASILDRFSASLCDHVRGANDSAAIIHDLERSNLFVVPLDEEREWFRFHHLFAAVARSELELAHPDHVRTLHARAAEWFVSRGHTDEAIQHFLAADRTEEAALLVQANWLTYVDAGRGATVLGWLESLGSPAASSSPAARVTTAWMAAFVGNEAVLADQLAALADVGDHGPLPDGSRSVESAVSLIRGLFGYGGPLDILAAARRAVELETDTQTPHYAIAHVSLGHGLYLQGDLDQASIPLRVASLSDRAPGVVRVLSLSLESFVETARGDLGRARDCAELAMDIVDAHGLRASPHASLAFAALGQAQASAGKLDDALETLEVGLAIRRQTTAQGVWGPIHHLLITARVAAQSGRPELARELMTELSSRMGRYTDGMSVMHARVAEVQRLLSDDVADARFEEPLTGRELDVLRLLQGDLVLNDIALQLYLSSNTVKTHARAVYRKLGAHSRAEAVQIARRQSLI